VYYYALSRSGIKVDYDSVINYLNEINLSISEENWEKQVRKDPDQADIEEWMVEQLNKSDKYMTYDEFMKRQQFYK
jgi:hypothetical protein